MILDNCQSMAGVNNIYLIVIMHQEHRPFQAKKFPHNPVRETFMAEGLALWQVGQYAAARPLWEPWYYVNRFAGAIIRPIRFRTRPMMV